VTSQFINGAIVFAIVLLFSCGDSSPEDSKRKALELRDSRQGQCGDAILDASGAPLVAVSEPLLYREESGYYRVGLLASEKVLESYPERLSIVRQENADPQAISVLELLQVCQVEDQLNDAEVLVNEGDWEAAKVLGFHNDGKSVAILKNDSKETVGYQSVRFFVLGDNSERN